LTAASVAPPEEPADPKEPEEKTGSSSAASAAAASAAAAPAAPKGDKKPKKKKGDKKHKKERHRRHRETSTDNTSGWAWAIAGSAYLSLPSGTGLLDTGCSFTLIGKTVLDDWRASAPDFIQKHFKPLRRTELAFPE